MSGERGGGSGAEILDRVRETEGIAVERTTGDQHVGAGCSSGCHRLGSDSSIDFDVDLLVEARARIISRTSAIFGSIDAMYCWPPNPGLTVITNTRSTKSST